MPRQIFLEEASYDVTDKWVRLLPAIQTMRKSGRVTLYEDFEFLAVLCQRWLASHPDGTYAPGYPRLDPSAPSGGRFR